METVSGTRKKGSCSPLEEYPRPDAVTGKIKGLGCGECVAPGMARRHYKRLAVRRQRRVEIRSIQLGCNA